VCELLGLGVKKDYWDNTGDKIIFVREIQTIQVERKHYFDKISFSLYVSLVRRWLKKEGFYKVIFSLYLQ
jgi:hypothetical protein